MRFKGKKIKGEFMDPQDNIDEIHEPLAMISHTSLKDTRGNSYKSIFQNLFQQKSLHQPSRKVSQSPEMESQKTINDAFLKKIISNTKNPKNNQSPLHKKMEQKDKTNPEYFCFNNTIKTTYPQTPKFKSLLQSPFKKFNASHQSAIEELKESNSKSQFNQLKFDSNPNDYYDKKSDIFLSGKYFVGIALALKEENSIPEAYFFFKLASFCEPFNEKIWSLYISLAEEQFNFEKAFILSKTAFLFTHEEEFSKKYLQNGEKCGVKFQWLQGLIASISNPEDYQKSALTQSAKLQIKYGQSWKGIILLHQIMKKNDYRLSQSTNIMFLAKFLENIGKREMGMRILTRSFRKNMSKLQVYLLYFEMKARSNNGKISQQDINQMLCFLENVLVENRYKFYLYIAEILYHENDGNYQSYIEKSYTSAKKYCTSITAYNKAMRQIFFSVGKWKGINLQYQVMDDQMIFQKNRYNFIHGYPLIEGYDFEGWKFYLHYGVAKNDKILKQACQKFPKAGRLFAEWIHVLRIKKDPLTMLKIWRKKIDELPMSGELWCEGGRIYAELSENRNALFCFKCAIHFTPQYGDSFLEEIKIYLQDGLFWEVQRCKKIFLVSEPFYGHVLSFLKMEKSSRKLSMSEIWEKAVGSIKEQLYKKNTRRKNVHNLTAYQQYNDAFLEPKNKQQRQWLFSSYEVMENRN